MLEGDSYEDYESSCVELPFRPPIDEYAAKMGMEGKFGPSKIEQRIYLIKWPRRPEVVEAYKKLQKQTGIAWEKATWDFWRIALAERMIVWLV